MIKIEDFYYDVLDSIQKEDNGMLSEEAFTRYTNRASLKMLTDLVLHQQDPRVQDFMQAREDLLHPFIVQIPMATTSGFFLKPADYAFYKNIRAAYDDGKNQEELNELYGELCKSGEDPSINIMLIKDQIALLIENDVFVDVELMSQHKIASRMKSAIPNKRPSERKPVGEQVNKGFQVYPKSVGSLALMYYRNPNKCKLVMTTDPSTLGRAVDLFNSVDIEWPESARELLVMYVSTYFSISQRDRDLFSMLQNVQQTVKK